MSEADPEHKTCDYCGVTLTRNTVEIQGYDIMFCSRRCAGKFCYGD